MCKGDNPKNLKFRILAFGDFVQAFGPHLGISLYLALIYSV